MRIFGTSLPRSGTHFLEIIFTNLGYRIVTCRKTKGVQHLPEEARVGDDDIYAMGHWRCVEPFKSELRTHGYRPIALVRDPRDVCLSLADVMHSGRPRHLFKAVPALRDLSWKEHVLGIIKGYDLPGHRTKPINVFCTGWTGWREEGGILLHYEDLVHSAEARTALPVFAEVGLDPDAVLEASVKSLRSSASVTLNKARVARWKEDFDAEMLGWWDQYAGDTAHMFGY